MKYFALLLLPLLLTVTSCGNGNSSASGNDGDTTVATINHNNTYNPNSVVKEYRLVIGKDTTNMSYIFAKLANETKVNIDIEYFKTSVFTGEKFKTSYRKMSYELQLNAFAKILEKASKDYDLKNVVSMQYSLLPSGALDLELTKALKASGSDNVAPVVEKSRLVSDLNKLLKPYSLAVDQVNCDNCQLVEKQRFIDDSEVKPGEIIPDEMIDCIVGISLKRIGK
jgi:hypothetical protein